MFSPDIPLQRVGNQEVFAIILMLPLAIVDVIF
jgi:hypothetical protein